MGKANDKQTIDERLNFETNRQEKNVVYVMFKSCNTCRMSTVNDASLFLLKTHGVTQAKMIIDDNPRTIEAEIQRRG